MLTLGYFPPFLPRWNKVVHETLSILVILTQRKDTREIGKFFNKNHDTQSQWLHLRYTGNILYKTTKKRKKKCRWPMLVAVRRVLRAERQFVWRKLGRLIYLCDCSGVVMALTLNWTLADDLLVSVVAKWLFLLLDRAFEKLGIFVQMVWKMSYCTLNLI